MRQGDIRAHHAEEKKIVCSLTAEKGGGPRSSSGPEGALRYGLPGILLFTSRKKKRPQQRNTKEHRRNVMAHALLKKKKFRERICERKQPRGKVFSWMLSAGGGVNEKGGLLKNNSGHNSILSPRGHDFKFLVEKNLESARGEHPLHCPLVPKP